MALTEQEKAKVLELKSRGFSLEQIGSYVGGRRFGRDSTISDIELNEFKQKQEEASGALGTIKEAATDIKETGESVLSSFKKSGEDIVDIATDPSRNIAEKVVGVGGRFAGGIAGAIGEASIGAGKVVLPQEAEDNLKAIAIKAAKGVASTDIAQDAINWYNSQDEVTKKNIDAAGGFASLLAELGGAKVVKKVGSEIARGSKKVGSEVVEAGKALARKIGAKTADEAEESGAKMLQDVRRYVPKAFTEKNLSPQVGQSAVRVAKNEDVTSLYDKYFEQTKATKTNAKADLPLASVGEDIGVAFKDVVTKRRAIGKKMAEELEKVKDVTTDVSLIKSTFDEDLVESGLLYDEGKIVQTAKQSKIGAADRSLLETYANEVDNLGDMPTVKDVDAFISRVNDDLKIYKSKNNITGTTNSERIIKKSLEGLRNSLTESAGKEYADARRVYADLSSFIEEGEGYLGKVTQSGDFAKDASLAKSAVQSILNNGKKDWLIELEALTGSPLLDKSVIALQAMKDAGEFRGLSLLEAVSSGGLPMSKVGFTQKVVDYALGKAGEVVAGSPEEQTRAFLRRLLDANVEK